MQILIKKNNLLFQIEPTKLHFPSAIFLRALTTKCNRMYYIVENGKKCK